VSETHPGTLAPPLVRDAGDWWRRAMLRGDFAAGWEISDRIYAARRGQPRHVGPRHEQILWDGAPLHGRRVLLRCYHGLGDTIQFIRYAPLVKAIAREVIVWAQPELLPLLRTADGIDALLPLHEGTPEVECDRDVELMELPYIFRTNEKTIPAHVPYLHWPEKISPSPRSAALQVGLVWCSGNWDSRRSVPLAELEPLTRIRGVTLHALQRGSALAEWPSDWGPISGADEIESLAAKMLELDLIISVDSMPAHLAGALGRRVWTLLSANADWRWMEHRVDSPWYPTMRLFRQPSLGNWRAPIQQIAAALIRVRDQQRSRESVT
jgi:hypothetical protein